MLTVTLKIKELTFDVMNKTHVTARSLQASGKLNYESAAHMQASTDPENSYEILRGINDSIAETKVELGEYLSDTKTNTTNLIDGNIEESASNNDPTVTLQFDLPGNYNSAAADALGAGIHEFIVGRTIYAWYVQTVPELAEKCLVDAEAALVKAKKALYKRSRPTRPTYSE